MFKNLLFFLFILILPKLGEAQKGDVRKDKGTEPLQKERVFFPVILGNDLASSMNLYMDAFNTFDSTHVQRQAFLENFPERFPLYYIEALQAERELDQYGNTRTIYSIDYKFIKEILLNTNNKNKGRLTPIIDTLLFADVFLGSDNISDFPTKYEPTEAETNARMVATDKPKLDPRMANSLEGGKGKEHLRYMKESFFEKIKARDAIWLDPKFAAPVFLEASLLGDGTDDIQERIYQFAFEWMVFANAYPKQYEAMSGVVKTFIQNNNWSGLFYFCQENLNPANYQAEIQFALNNFNM